MKARVLFFLGDALPGVLLPLALFAVGVLYLIFLRGFFLFHPIRFLKVVFRKNGSEAMRALSMALAGTLGVGNIAGVALAVALGGAGAVFWMWLSAFFAMLLKYAETVLALLFREKDVGGAMYYMRWGIGGRVGGLLALSFSVLCVISALTLGSSVQANAAAEGMSKIGVPPVFSAVVITVLSAFAVTGGAKRIKSITVRLIPVLTLFYIFLAAYACIKNASLFPSVLSRIFKDAARPFAAVSGGAAFLSQRAVRYGVTRGLLSNEAGAGTAPLAHATAKNTPVSQGLFGMIEVFIDTFVLCSATAFVVLMAYESPDASGGGTALVLDAFSVLVGPWTRVPLVFSIVLFVFATIICWCFYGERSVLYLASGKRARWIYLGAFLLSLFCGSFFSGEVLWSVTDVSLSAMTLLNLLALLYLAPLVRAETEKTFFGRTRIKERTRKEAEKPYKDPRQEAL